MTKRISQSIRVEGKHPIAFKFIRRASVVGRYGVRRLINDPQRSKEALKGHSDSAHSGMVVNGCPACRELLNRIAEGKKGIL